ncbi:MAG TPA: xanthine dehydrogenase family protein subunit M [Desulfomonilaceae bacterium]|nr:xanthine dehydrogenase family protein subunit M [Desulfomonilaceae bacterium]
MRTYQYLKPTSLAEVLELLKHYGPKAKIVAGGTDVMIQWKKKLLSPDYFISLRNVPELNFISYRGDLRIGSATTHRTLELSPEIRNNFPVIRDAVSGLGSVQVRNSATIGGNLCNAAPSADTAPPMLVLDTEVKIVSADGERSVPVRDFFKGPGRTVLEPGELVRELCVPEPLPNTGMAYWKHTRRKAMDLPILGVAVLMSFGEDLKTCVKARIGLGVAAPVPMRVRAAEEFLEGKVVDEIVLNEAGEMASEQARPRSTIRGSEWYRREMIRVLVKRTGLMCQERAKGEGRS